MVGSQLIPESGGGGEIWEGGSQPWMVPCDSHLPVLMTASHEYSWPLWRGHCRNDSMWSWGRVIKGIVILPYCLLAHSFWEKGETSCHAKRTIKGHPRGWGMKASCWQPAPPCQPREWAIWETMPSSLPRGAAWGGHLDGNFLSNPRPQSPS